jgi:hypothetical protein
MTTPPTNQGKQLLYNQENRPQPSPLQQPRHMTTPPTAVIQPGAATPSPISPNAAQNFGMTPGPSIHRTLSSESSKRQTESEPNPKPSIKPKRPLTSVKIKQTPTPPIQEVTWVELVTLTRAVEEPRSTPLEWYWNEDQ